jgi:hypothetical protein
VAKIDKSEQIDHSRRRFVGTAAVSAAAAQLGLTRTAPAQTKSSSLPAIKPGLNTSFGPLKQVLPATSMLAMPNPARAMVLPSFCCTAGLTTSIVSSMLRRYWRRPAVG